MFSMKIADSDAFLDMPQSSQLLYFHLGMRADDDGFVSNPKRIMRMIGSQDDDFKVLLTKRFILPFENGVCVIKHWKLNNYIQKDRYTSTVYLEEKKQLRIKENGAYTECIQNGYVSDTQVSIGKSKNTSAKAEKTMKKSGFKYNENQHTDSFEEIIDADTGEIVEDTPKTNVDKIMRDIVQWAEKRRGSKFPNQLKQRKALSNARKSDISPKRIKLRWEEMEREDFWAKAGFDFMDVVNSFNRKP